jgi:uncharacterized protein
LSAPVLAATASDTLLESLKPQGFVSDFAGILSPAQREAMESLVRGVQQETGAQVAVVTLQSLEGGQVDDFAGKLFRRWGIGQKDKNNGVLLLVALKDRKARIEVGYGLEPILPDALAGRVLDEELFPAFRQGRYAEGLDRGLRRVAEIIKRGEPAPKSVAPTGKSGAAADWPEMLFLTLFLGLFVAIGFFFAGTGLGARQGLPIIWGLFFGGIPCFIGSAYALAAGTSMPLIALACVGGVTACLGVWTGRRQPKSYGRKRSHGTSGWVWGGSSGGTSGWSSGGGFSSSGGGGFGGGSSGGGGASGSW